MLHRFLILELARDLLDTGRTTESLLCRLSIMRSVVLSDIMARFRLKKILIRIRTLKNKQMHDSLKMTTVSYNTKTVLPPC